MPRHYKMVLVSHSIVTFPTVQVLVLLPFSSPTRKLLLVQDASDFIPCRLDGVARYRCASTQTGARRFAIPILWHQRERS